MDENNEFLENMDDKNSDIIDVNMIDVNSMDPQRICLVGCLASDTNVCKAAESFGVPVVTSDTGQEYIYDTDFVTYYIVPEFEGPIFNELCQLKCRILGPTALQELAEKHEELPSGDRLRPLFSSSMRGIAVCLTGFRDKEEVNRLVKLMHHMGGSIRAEMTCKITHLLANQPGGKKYQYATTFNIPVLRASWVTAAWDNRHVLGYSCRADSVILEHKLKFGGAKVCFMGFTPEETEHMTHVLESNNGVLSSLKDCSHVVSNGRLSVAPAVFEKGNLHPLPGTVITSRCNLIPNPSQAPTHKYSLRSRNHSSASMSPLRTPTQRYPLRLRAQSRASMPPLQTSLEGLPAAKPLVVDDVAVLSLPENAPRRAHVVKAEWFWSSVQNELCADEREYLFEDYLESMLSPDRKRYQSTPVSGNGAHCLRKRKRLQDRSLLSQLESPLNNKRRSSISDAGLLSLSGSYLEVPSPDPDLYDAVEGSVCSKTSARRQVFEELVQTETNYVNILDTIIELFKKPLEDMLSNDSTMLLNATELKIIFGNLLPIYECHSSMLEDMKLGLKTWAESYSVGNLITKYAAAMVKAYPPFINYFEETKETLGECEKLKPRFYAFLKIRQRMAECGRQSLKELLIRPVQRLPAISLLLNDLLKHTDKSNPDHAALEEALTGIKEVMTHMNEDKRKTEAQLAMFQLFNDIDNCPPHLISSHRSLVAQCDCIELTESFSSKRSEPLTILLFTDTLAVCKRRHKMTSIHGRSAKPSSLQKVNKQRKMFKFIRLLPLSNINKVIDVREAEDCQNVFVLQCRTVQSLREAMCSFTVSDPSCDKVRFLKDVCKQMAHTLCTTDPEDYFQVMDCAQVDAVTSSGLHNTSVRSTTHSFSKVFRFASKTGVKVGRALSMSKTPNKFSKAVSSMRPFAIQGNMTPNAAQLAQMRLQSCANLQDLQCTPSPSLQPPMSVQPTRRNMLASTFSVSSLKL